MSTWNEYDQALAVQRSREKFAQAQDRFEQLVDLLKHGAQPIWPLWCREFAVEPVKE